MLSLIYLNNYILKLLDLKISPYEALMFNLEKNLPVVDNLMFYDNNKLEAVNYRSELSEQSLEVLDDYTLLLYDITTGEQYSRDKIGRASCRERVYIEMDDVVVERII